MGWGFDEDTLKNVAVGGPTAINQPIYSALAGGAGNLKRDVFGGKQQDEANSQYHNIEAGIQDEYSKLGEENRKLLDAEGIYQRRSDIEDEEWTKKLGQYRDQSDQQAKDASTVYSNTILPNATKYLEDSKREADNAMSLQQAQDPNNSVAKSFRDFYEKQAQGEGQQGLADTGILQSMGAQAMQQYGNVPMTGAQMQLAQATNQAQAGQAYANTQKRIQSLRDQGLQQGWDQTDKAYNRGQAAKDRYGNSISGLQAIQGNNINQQQSLRGEGSSYGQRQRDTAQGANARNATLAANQAGRASGLISGQSGATRALQTNDMNALSAQSTARANILPQFIGQAVGVGGQIAAASAGAPAPNISQGMQQQQPQQQAPQTTPQQQQSNYSPYGSYARYA